MKLAIGCDALGYDLKETIYRHLRAKGYDIEDYGVHSSDIETPYYEIAAAQLCC